MLIAFIRTGGCSPVEFDGRGMQRRGDRGIYPRRKGALAFVIACLLAVLAVGGAATASGGDDQSSMPPPPPDDFAASVPRDDAPSAASQEELDASAAAFGDLSDNAALQTIRHNFSGALKAELVPEPSLPEGTKVGTYIDETTALIVPEDAPSDERQVLDGGVSRNLLLESSLPLRAPDDGAMKPLDGDLEAHGDHFAADNPLVASQIPGDLSDGAVLPADDLRFTPQQAQATEGEPVADKVFYPNAATDTDYLIAPTATGFELYVQMRSPDSPTEFPIEVRAGGSRANVQLESGGRAIISAQGSALAVVSPPSAFDAAGQQIPTRLDLDGDSLVVRVSAAATSDAQWPILVDPIVDEYNWGANQPDPDLAMWDTATNFDNGFNAFYNTGEGGVMNRALGGKSYPQNSFGEWVAQSIRASYIERIDYLNFDRSPTAPGNCTIMGIYQPWQGAWAPTTFYNPASNSSTYSGGQAYCSSSAHESRFVWVGANAMPDGAGGDLEAADGSQGIFQLSSSPGARSSNAQNLLRGAKIYRYDRNAPSITSAVPSSAWTQAPTISVHDAGLGAAGVWVFRAGTFNLIGSAEGNCAGGRKDVCPTDATYTINNLPEGRTDVAAAGVDPVLNGSVGQSWAARIDRTGPNLALSGDLAGIQNNAFLGDGTHQLVAAASDGSTTSASSERAGVTYLAVVLDGTTVSSKQQACPASSCSAQAGSDFDSTSLSPGQHSLAIGAVDAAGNLSFKTINFRIQAPISISSDWLDPADGQVFQAGFPKDKVDPYVKQPLPPAPPSQPACDEGEQPSLADPYNDEWNDPCLPVGGDDYFDEDAVQIPDSQPDLRLQIQVDSTNGLGSVASVGLKVDESSFGATCATATCTWVIPRDRIIADAHAIDITATDTSGNTTSRQIVALDGDIIDPAISPAGGSSGGFAAALGADTASFGASYADGIELHALGMSAVLEPTSHTSGTAQGISSDVVSYQDSAQGDPRANMQPIVDGVESRYFAGSDAAQDLTWDLSLDGETSAVEDLGNNEIVLTRPFPAIDPADFPPPPDDPGEYLDESYQPDPASQAEYDSGAPESWSAGSNVGPVERQYQNAVDEAAEASRVDGAEAVAVMDLKWVKDSAGNTVPATLSADEHGVSLDAAAGAGKVTVKTGFTMVAPMSYGSQCIHAFGGDLANTAKECFQPPWEEEVLGTDGASDTGQNTTFPLAQPVTLRYDANDKEKEWCIWHSGLCKDYRDASAEAARVSDLLFKNGNEDGFRANAFKHMFWVVDMINRRPELRDTVKGVYRRHEWNDTADVYLYNLDVQNWVQHHPGADAQGLRNLKYASQMDMLNNRTAWGMYTVHRAHVDHKPRYCQAVRNHAEDAKFLGSKASPFKWGDLHPNQKFERAVFRWVKHGGVKAPEKSDAKWQCAHL